MFRKSFSKCILISFISIFIVTTHTFAEKVKPLNPDCDSCPVAISYDGDEARNILGKDGMSQIMKIDNKKKKTRKIDLDGIKRIGTEKDSDNGYELLVFVRKKSIVINFLEDLSAIKIITDLNGLELHRDVNKWNPEIQLLLSRANEIKKTDNLDSAWKKVKDSSMYKYTNNSIDHRKWNSNFSRFLSNVLETAIGN